MNNSSGIQPIEFNVLILPDAVSDKTEGGIFKPDTLVDQDKHRATQGTLVAMSPLAFNEDIWPSETARPEPGQRVSIALHAGHFQKGSDGVEYRLVKDKDVTALLA